MKFLFLVLIGFCFCATAQEPRMVLPEAYADFKEITFSPNGKQILVSAGDSTILLFDVNTGRRLFAIKTVNNDISFNATGDLFVVTDDNYPNEKSFIYNTKSFNVLFECKGGSPKFTKDNRFIATNYGDNIALYDIDNGSLIKTFAAGSGIEEFSFSPDGKTVLILSNGHVYNYDIAREELVYPLNMTDDVFIHFANYSPAKDQFLSVQDREGKKEVVLVNSTTGKQIKIIHTYENDDYYTLVRPVFNESGNIIIVPSTNKIWVYDTKSGELINKLNFKDKIPSIKAIKPLTIKEKGEENKNYLVIGFSEYLKVVDLQNKSLEFEIKEAASIEGVTTYSEKAIIATALSKGKANLWDLNRKRKTHSFGHENLTVEKLSFTADNKSVQFSFNKKIQSSYDIVTGKGRSFIQNEYGNRYSPDGNYEVVFTDFLNLEIRNVKTKTLIKKINEIDEYHRYYRFSHNNKLFCVAGYTKIWVFELETGQLIFTSSGFDKRITDVSFSPCGNFLLASGRDFISLFDILSGKEANKLIAKKNTWYYNPFFSPNSQYIVVYDKDNATTVYTTNTFKKILDFSNEHFYPHVSFNPDDRFVFIQRKSENTLSTERYSLDKKAKKLTVNSNNQFLNNINFKPKRLDNTDETTYFLSAEDNKLVLYDPNNLTPVKKLQEFDKPIFSTIWDPNGNYVFCVTSENPWFGLTNSKGYLVDTSTGDLLLTINNCTSGTFSSDGGLLLTKDVVSNKSSLWDMKTHSPIYSRVQLQDNNYLITLPNSKYYMCSKDASKMVHYVTDELKVIGFEQLDPVYNRPDKVLEHIAQYIDDVDLGMIDVYRRAWEKRAEQLGLDIEKIGNGELNVPEAEITNGDAIDYYNTSGAVNLSLSGHDKDYKLLRFNVYVNEVPVYGSRGVSLANRNIKHFDTTLSVPLTLGDNKVQVSVMNELGLESFKYPSYVNYEPQKTISPKTIFIGIAVDSFQQESYNLSYCVKDVTDLSDVFKALPNSEIITLTNSQVTRENVLALKKILQNTSVHDRVIISCSSHGDLDAENNFYLATHDMDFNQPELRGIPYAELEGLLDSIPARKKLLLLDACNSGLNDAVKNTHQQMIPDEDLVAENNTQKRGAVRANQEASNDEFQTMLELFVNVQNETGSTVISAAGGAEAAFEGILVAGKKLENGVFTHAILEYINEHQGQEVTVNTLKKYVEDRVEELTNGMQKPTSRQETMEVDWVLINL